jgi:hypothetical protein
LFVFAVTRVRGEGWWMRTSECRTRDEHNRTRRPHRELRRERKEFMFLAEFSPSWHHKYYGADGACGLRQKGGVRSTA